MKALSVRQPYAELIASGRKAIEVRTWDAPAGYRGPILIVASSNAWREDFAGYGLADADCPRRVAVCVVTLHDVVGVPRDSKLRQRCAEAACCDMQRGDRLWLLTNPRRVSPLAVKGRLRLFDVPDADILPYGDQRCPKCKARKLRACASGDPCQLLHCDGCGDTVDPSTLA